RCRSAPGSPERRGSRRPESDERIQPSSLSRAHRGSTMTRLRFGGFLAPHHPIGEHPTLQFRRDLDLAEHLDKLGFDEFWCGEHHSTGWEVIASPEMFL